MHSKKYGDDIGRCRQIGAYIEGRLYSVFGARGHKKVAKIFSGLTGLSEGSAGSYISDYRGGHFVFQISSESSIRPGGGGKLEKQTHLKRLAILFTILGVEQSDPVVGLVKEVNPQFNYPIVLEDPKAPREALRVDDIDLTVNLKSGRQLTQEQIDSLRRLAALYAVD